MAVPVTVVTGFLGAGKTTLVNRWLAGVPRGDIAVVVNEQGNVGIDGSLLAARATTLVEIAGGCVCCATQEELVRALADLAWAAPKRIVIETSGAASPAGVLHAVRGGVRIGAVALDGVITVVDASRLGALGEHDLAIEQIGYADVVVLSRADTCDAAESEAAAGAVATHNGAALVVTASQGELEDSSLDALLDRRRHDFAARPAPASPPAGTRAHADYESVSLVHDGSLDGDRFADFMEDELGRFAGRLFRTKGILAVEGVAERMIVQGVGDLAEVTFGDPWGDAPRRSRFVVVGFGLDGDALQRAFAACAVSGDVSSQ